MLCALCGRDFEHKDLTRHHCLPRSHGGTEDDVALLCAGCHTQVHATFTNATLAALYASIERLRQAPELRPYVAWVRRQAPSRRLKNRSRRERL